MSSHRVSGSIAAATSVVVFSNLAAAQANYHSAPLGGRSALLGGTGVAIGVDGAAPFLNPASIVRISDRRIAFSARFFRLSQRTLVHLQQPGSVDPAYGPLELPNATSSTTSLRSVPDTTCYFFSRSRGDGATLTGRSKLALCVAKTDENEFEINALDYRGQSAGHQVDQSRSFREIWSKWSVGPTFAVYLREDLAVGASLHLTRTRHETLSQVGTVAEDLASGTTLASSYQSVDTGSSWDAVAQFGVTYKMSERVTFGASVRPPSLHILGNYSASEDSRFEDGTTTVSHWGGNGSFTVHSPLRLDLGIGAEYKRLRIEGNVFFHTGVEKFARAELDRDRVDLDGAQPVARARSHLVRSESVRPVVNAGLGVEYFVSKDLSLLLGLASDVSAARKVSSGPSEDRLFHTRWNSWHAGLGISSYTRFGDFVFGARGDYSSGQFAAVNGFVEPAERDPISVHEWAMLLIIAGRVSLDTVAESAENVTEAVKGTANAPSSAPRKPLQRPKVE